MRDSIYTIPISEVFEPKCGCPLCSMAKTMETRCIDYILGAAMMEPDIRIETNKYGFCSTHYSIMIKRNNKLSLALMLKTHLDDLATRKQTAKPKKIESTCSCFVCKEIEQVMERLVSNTVKMYASSEEFKQLFNQQEYFCYPHFKLLTEVAYKSMHKKILPLFIDDVTRITKNQMDKVTQNVYDFTQMFDYRNGGKEKTAEVTSAVENAISFLVGS